MMQSGWAQRVRPRIRRLLMFGALVTVALALVLTVVELSIRYVRLSDAAEVPDYTENASYVPMRIKANYEGDVGGRIIRTNSHGFRDEEEFDPARPAGEFRILSMGDSIAFGLTLAAEDAYAKVLERGLNSDSGTTRFNVINAAGPGYDPSAYYLFLKNEALRWDLNLVIAEVELTNDVTDSALLEWVPDPDDPEAPIRLKGGRYVTAWDGALLSAYVRGPYFFEKTYTYVELSRRVLDLLYRRAAVKPFPPGPGATIYYTLGYEWYLLTEERIEAGWQRLLGAVGATDRLLERANVPFLLMVMPSRAVYEGGDPSPQRELARELVDRMVTFARENGIPHLDLSGPIGEAGGAAVFLDTVHLNEAGNVAVGNALEAYLRDGLLAAAPQR